MNRLTNFFVHSKTTIDPSSMENKGDTPMLNIATRQLRASTEEQRQTTHQTPPRRTILKRHDTASLLRTPGHNSYDFNPEKTLSKMSTRFQTTFDRFLIAYVWKCNTERGRTYLNGSQAHCKKEHHHTASCQAAHASMTPHLKDNYLTLVAAEIKEKGFENTAPEFLEYFFHRFNLTSETRIELQGMLSDAEFVDYLLSKIPAKNLKGSFIGTVKEMQRNATFEQPTGCNQIDCCLERSLRKLEDKLAHLCTKQEITAQQAMKLFFTQHGKLLDSLIWNVEKRQRDLTAFIQLHYAMLEKIQALHTWNIESTSEEQYSEFIAAATTYLNKKQQLEARSFGCPPLGDFLRYSLGCQIQYALKRIAFRKNPTPVNIRFLHLTKTQLKTGLINELELKAQTAELRVRLLEAKTQKDKIIAVMESPPNFAKVYYGLYDPVAKVRRTPSKQEIHSQLVEQSHTTKPPVAQRQLDLANFQNS